MSMNKDPPPSYKVNDHAWNSERWESKDWEPAPTSTKRQLSIWEQTNAIVFDLPELRVYIVDSSALSSYHKRIALAALNPKNKDEVYFGNSKTNTLKGSLKQGLKSGLKRGAKHGFKADFMTTFKNNLKRNKETDSVDHHYVARSPIDFLNLWKERLRGEIMEAWVLDGMNPSPVDRISRSKFWVAKYMIKIRVIKGASCEYRPCSHLYIWAVSLGSDLHLYRKQFSVEKWRYIDFLDFLISSRTTDLADTIAKHMDTSKYDPNMLIGCKCRAVQS